MAEKVLVAMSGGVDSTVSVRVLQEKGYEVAGATMKLLEDSDERVEKTAALAKRLGIDFFVFDLTAVFARDIIDEFAKSYAEGLTPNPCVRCNKLLKFGRLLDLARERGFSKIATGHYARIVAVFPMPVSSPVGRPHVDLYIALHATPVAPHFQNGTAEIRSSLQIPYARIHDPQFAAANGAERGRTQGGVVPDRLHMPLGEGRVTRRIAPHATSFSAFCSSTGPATGSSLGGRTISFGTPKAM